MSGELATAWSSSNGLPEAQSGTSSTSGAAETISDEVARLMAPHIGSHHGHGPHAVSVQCWERGLAVGSLGLEENCVSLEPWRLAIAGEYLRTRSSPLEAAACSGLEAGERVASWFA